MDAKTFGDGMSHTLANDLLVSIIWKLFLGNYGIENVFSVFNPGFFGYRPTYLLYKVVTTHRR